MVCVSTTAAWAQNEDQANCSGLPTAGQLKQLLAAAPSHGGDAGGLFHGTRMWAAVVNRNGELCAFATSTADATQVWPGSQAIAKAKAYTANAFSLDALALSTAMLYTFTQPGHSLWGLNQSNLFNPDFLAPPNGAGPEFDAEAGHHRSSSPHARGDTSAAGGRAACTAALRLHRFAVNIMPPPVPGGRSRRVRYAITTQANATPECALSRNCPAGRGLSTTRGT